MFIECTTFIDREINNLLILMGGLGSNCGLGNAMILQDQPYKFAGYAWIMRALFT
jgi:hypothetical protein